MENKKLLRIVQVMDFEKKKVEFLTPLGVVKEVSLCFEDTGLLSFEDTKKYSIFYFPTLEEEKKIRIAQAKDFLKEKEKTNQKLDENQCLYLSILFDL